MDLGAYIHHGDLSIKTRKHDYLKELYSNLLCSQMQRFMWVKIILRSCPCKNRPLGFRPKTEFLRIFRVRQLVYMINKNGNNLAFNAIFQYFWRQFQRTVQNRLNRSVSSQI